MISKIFLVCTSCPVKHANYLTSKTKQVKEKKIILRKYCPFCRQKQFHKEEVVKGAKK